ncbi:hypothetical protein AGLY_017545 [Aphis glycines]|uniref:Uncharacterized protein n=1 Tax=Aphis glycines TaxID=307491 RepID=A0A6G0SUR8_APHGL|nr:hypothetical protein AGLY_017545 [Aphis glycines]
MFQQWNLATIANLNPKLISRYSAISHLALSVLYVRLLSLVRSIFVVYISMFTHRDKEIIDYLVVSIIPMSYRYRLDSFTIIRTPLLYSTFPVFGLHICFIENLNIIKIENYSNHFILPFLFIFIYKIIGKLFLNQITITYTTPSNSISGVARISTRGDDKKKIFNIQITCKKPLFCFLIRGPLYSRNSINRYSWDQDYMTKGALIQYTILCMLMYINSLIRPADHNPFNKRFSKVEIKYIEKCET